MSATMGDAEARRALVEELEKGLGHCFGDRELLHRALTHRSHTSSAGRQNETLEFLGDAVIGLAVSELLVRRWPASTEGQLSRRRAALVNADALAAKGAELGLGAAILLGRGEEKSGGRKKRSILSGGFEAILGALFLDGGFAAARAAVERCFASDIETDPSEGDAEYKTRLQELTQRVFRVAPEYVVRGVSGPDHARDFACEVSIQGRIFGSGSGQSKKIAEQAAARRALEALRTGGVEGGEMSPQPATESENT